MSAYALQKITRTRHSPHAVIIWRGFESLKIHSGGLASVFFFFFVLRGRGLPQFSRLGVTPTQSRAHMLGSLASGRFCSSCHYSIGVNMFQGMISSAKCSPSSPQVFCAQLLKCYYIYCRRTSRSVTTEGDLESRLTGEQGRDVCSIYADKCTSQDFWKSRSDITPSHVGTKERKRCITYHPLSRVPGLTNSIGSSSTIKFAISIQQDAEHDLESISGWCLVCIIVGYYLWLSFINLKDDYCLRCPAKRQETIVHFNIMSSRSFHRICQQNLWLSKQLWSIF